MAEVIRDGIAGGLHSQSQAADPRPYTIIRAA